MEATGFNGIRLRPSSSHHLLVCRRFATLQCALPAALFGREPSLEKTIIYFCENEQLDRAIQILASIKSCASDDTYIPLLHACIKKKDLLATRKVSAHVASYRTDISGLLGDSLVISLARCGGVDDAWKVHHALRRRTVSSWSAVICGYADCGKWQEALLMYQSMHEDGLEPDRFAYVSLFKACSSMLDLEAGTRLQNEVKHRGLVSNVYIANSILTMYGKCGSMERAENFFVEMNCHNIVSWNAMLSGYIEQGEPIHALLLFRQMHVDGVEPNELTFVMALKACHGKEKEEYDGLEIGRALHADAQRMDFTSHLLVASTLMCMYGKYGNVKNAEGVFGTLSHHNVVTWTTLLKSYVEQGKGKVVLLGYRKMLTEGFHLDSHSYVLFFQACCSLAEDNKQDSYEGPRVLKSQILEIGQALHKDAKKRGLALDAYVCGILVSMYEKCGNIVEAEKVFNDLSHQDVVSWNVMLSAYVDQSMGDKALALYRRMVEAGIPLDERTAVSTLQACIICIEQGYEDGTGIGKFVAIGQMLCLTVCKLGFTSNIFVNNTIMNFYGKCRSIWEAEKIFLSFANCHITSWNVLLCVYLEQGCAKQALQLYRQLLDEGISPDERTYVTILQACSILLDANGATVIKDSLKAISFEIVCALHADVKRKGLSSQVFIANSLITSYAKCGALKEAEIVFSSLSGGSVVSWNAMLSAYMELGKGKLVLLLFMHMLKIGATPDPQTFVIVIQASCLIEEKQAGSINELSTSFCIGQALHFEAQKRGLAVNVFVSNTLTRMYGRHGRLSDAVDVFRKLEERNIVSWNAILSGLAEKGDGDQALKLFKELLKQELPLNDITLVCVLQLCSETGLRDVCQYVHFAAVCSGLDDSCFVATTILHAYGCCGELIDGGAVFNAMCQPRVESWNALLTAVAGEGNLAACVDLLSEIIRRDSNPTRFTFIALLMACSHTGLVKNGLELLLYMAQSCGLHAELKHYVIMVDLLGRAGDFGKVESMLSRIPMQPDLVFWLSLLGACRMHGHVELGKRAYVCALQLQPDDAALYVSMSNIYAVARRKAHADVMDSLVG